MASDTTSSDWLPYTSKLCDELNEQPCVVLVVEEKDIKAAQNCVDRAIERFLARVKDTPITDPNPIVSGIGTTTKKVRFSDGDMKKDDENNDDKEGTPIDTAQHCLAMHVPPPFLCLVDMSDDDNVVVYRHSLREGSEGIVAAEAVTEFLLRVRSREEPTALQGAAPTVHDLFPPSHEVVLWKGRYAVSASLQRLKQSALCGSNPSSCVVVYWSDRCPCCPAVIALVEALLSLLDCSIDYHYRWYHGGSKDTGRLRVPFMVCNIDENDLTEDDWPSDPEQQIVPTIAVYTPYGPKEEGTGTGLVRHRYTGVREPHALMAYFISLCLPSVTESPCVTQIAEEALRCVQGTEMEDFIGPLASPSHEVAPPLKAMQERVYTMISEKSESKFPVAERLASLRELHTACGYFNADEYFKEKIKSHHQQSVGEEKDGEGSGGYPYTYTTVLETSSRGGDREENKPSKEEEEKEKLLYQSRLRDHHKQSHDSFFIHINKVSLNGGEATRSGDVASDSPPRNQYKYPIAADSKDNPNPAEPTTSPFPSFSLEEDVRSSNSNNSSEVNTTNNSNPRNNTNKRNRELSITEHFALKPEH